MVRVIKFTRTKSSHLANVITSSLGEDTAGQIQEIIAQASETKRSIIGAIIVVVTLLVVPPAYSH